MDMIGARYRLRGDDLQDLQIERFLQNQQTVTDDLFVEALKFWIYGKSETGQVLLSMYAEQTHPEFDCVAHLLCYLYLTQIEKGYLFPNDQFLRRIMVRPNLLISREIQRALMVWSPWNRDTAKRSIPRSLRRWQSV
jgi:hypothetical protein